MVKKGFLTDCMMFTFWADPDKMASMMKNHPDGLVRFQVYTDKEKKMVTVNDRRKNRVKNKNTTKPSLDLWAHWVVNSIHATHIHINVVLGCVLAQFYT